MNTIMAQIYPSVIMFIVFFIIYLIASHMHKKRARKNITNENSVGIKESIYKQKALYENLKIGDKFEINMFDKTFVDVSEIGDLEDYKVYSIGFIEYANGNLHTTNKFIKVKKENNILIGKALSWELFR